MWTQECIGNIYQENSGYADYEFKRDQMDEIAQTEDADKNLRLIMEGFEPKSMFGFAIDQMGDKYIWRLKSAKSEVLRRGRREAGKYRTLPEHNKLMDVLLQADALLSRDR